VAKKTLWVVLLMLCATLACRTAQTTTAPAPPDPALEAEREEHVQEVLQQIVGREKEPAENVFKNIQVMKGIPAGRLLAIMNVGYARSLGVECSHCHVEDYWEVDEKRPKSAARDMILMTRAINEQVQKMKHLEGDQPFVNCGTCHQGHVRPPSAIRQ